MVIYGIVEWRLKWSRGGTLLNIAERKRRSSRDTDLERKLRIIDCDSKKNENCKLMGPREPFDVSCIVARFWRDTAAFNGQ